MDRVNPHWKRIISVYKKVYIIHELGWILLD